MSLNGGYVAREREMHGKAEGHATTRQAAGVCRRAREWFMICSSPADVIRAGEDSLWRGGLLRGGRRIWSAGHLGCGCAGSFAGKARAVCGEWTRFRGERILPLASVQHGLPSTRNSRADRSCRAGRTGRKVRRWVASLRLLRLRGVRVSRCLEGQRVSGLGEPHGRWQVVEGAPIRAAGFRARRPAHADLSQRIADG